MKKISIDINADVGEGFTSDADLMPFISSANIACGYHAGSVDIMKYTMDLAFKHKVAIGAHPGFNDKNNFGRNNIQLSNDGYYNLVSEQLNIMQQHITHSEFIIHHVKPHGALYNMAASNPTIAQIIAKAVFDFNHEIIFYGLSGSCMITEAKKIGLTTANEVFADRTYQPNGTLTSRKESNALIQDADQAIQQVLQIVETESVKTVDNTFIPMKADTICLHSDGKHAVEFATILFKTLKEHKIEIQTI